MVVCLTRRSDYTHILGVKPQLHRPSALLWASAFGTGNLSLTRKHLNGQRCPRKTPLFPSLAPSGGPPVTLHLRHEENGHGRIQHTKASHVIVYQDFEAWHVQAEAC